MGVPEFCTCGAHLPPAARFCHKCGKPQVELPVEEEPIPEIAPAVPVPPPSTAGEISFRNRVAVRVGLLAAAVTSLLISVPIPMYLNIVWVLVWLVGAGFLSVYLYRRRTGEELSVKKGARMGWITGVFCFVIATVFFTITLLVISNRGGLAQFYREQLSAQGTGAQVDLEQLLSVLESPAGVGGIIFFSLLMMFVFFTLLPTLGGAMGAKVLERER